MRKYFLMAILIIPIYCQSQSVVESIIDYSDRYSRLFSKESALISLDFVKRYEVNSTDTTYQFVLTILTSQVEMEGFSLGASFFSYGIHGATGNASFKITQGNGQSVMDRNTFQEFYDNMDKVYVLILQKASFGKDQKNIIASSTTNDITFKGDYDPTRGIENKVYFYFEVGDNQVFQMSQEDIKVILTVLRQINFEWHRVSNEL